MVLCTECNNVYQLDEQASQNSVGIIDKLPPWNAKLKPRKLFTELSVVVAELLEPINGLCQRCASAEPSRLQSGYKVN